MNTKDRFEVLVMCCLVVSANEVNEEARTHLFQERERKSDVGSLFFLFFSQSRVRGFVGASLVQVFVLGRGIRLSAGHFSFGRNFDLVDGNRVFNVDVFGVWRHLFFFLGFGFLLLFCVVMLW